MKSLSSVCVRSPANIALIKYMGKKDPGISGPNAPENPSVSLTLHGLCSGVELLFESQSAFEVRWSPEEVPAFEIERPWVDPSWSPDRIEKTRARVRSAVEAILQDIDHPQLGKWTVRSRNTFPAGAGIASSASFFSALTLAVGGAVLGTETIEHDLEVWAKRSSRISGSSGRSFFGPWVVWTPSAQKGSERIEKMEAAMPRLCDLVAVVESGHKEVSSSEAHRRVKTSPCWAQRTQRVEARTDAMFTALRSGDLGSVRALAWEEFEDMHRLFDTSQPPFSYQTQKSHQILEWARQKTSSIVTMDAGANVHILVPEEEGPLVERDMRLAFPEVTLIRDSQGTGPAFLERGSYVAGI